jgi:hypothetical protein
MLRRRRIAIQAARLFLPFPSVRRLTDTRRSVSLPNFLMRNESVRIDADSLSPEESKFPAATDRTIGGPTT